MMNFNKINKGLNRKLRSLSRNTRLYRVMNGIPFVILFFGMGLITLGMMSEISHFSRGFSGLVDQVGTDGIVPAAANYIQGQFASLLGVDQSVTAGDSSAEQALYATPEPENGFIPYQVPVGEQEHAPPLPNSPAGDSKPVFLPITGQAEEAISPTSLAETSAVVTAPAAPTSTPLPPADPGRIVIPQIGLDAPVINAPYQTIEVAGQTFEQWSAPGFYAAGWQEGSARLGEPGNTVLNGHHNIDGEVFGHLRDLQQGDEIIIYAGSRAFHYAVSQVMKLKERDAGIAQRQENARWVLSSTDERLTLVTCWPPASNTYRLIVVAVPVQK